jgi:hypothetical protein
MKAPPDPSVLAAQLAGLPADALFALYGDLLGVDAPGCATVARALKDAARAGKLDDDPDTRIALLVFCLVDAPSPAAAFHLAKALAAFGRSAQLAAPYVVDHVLELHVVDDETFWCFDGLLYCLGYLGGPAAYAACEAIAKDAPPRCARPKGIYEGALSLAERAAHHADTLTAVRGLLRADPGPWRAKRTSLTREIPARTEKANWRFKR